MTESGRRDDRSQESDRCCSPRSAVAAAVEAVSCGQEGRDPKPGVPWLSLRALSRKGAHRDDWRHDPDRCLIPRSAVIAATVPVCCGGETKVSSESLFGSATSDRSTAGKLTLRTGPRHAVHARDRRCWLVSMTSAERGLTPDL